MGYLREQSHGKVVVGVVVVGDLIGLELELGVCVVMCFHFCGFLGLFVVCFVSVHFVGCLCRS